jgi:hypothetical protein
MTSIDTTSHPLSDHQVHVESNTPPSHVHCVWPGKDYYNPTVAAMGDINRREKWVDRREDGGDGEENGVASQSRTNAL